MAQHDVVEIFLEKIAKISDFHLGLGAHFLVVDFIVVVRIQTACRFENRTHELLPQMRSGIDVERHLYITTLARQTFP